MAISVFMRTRMDIVKTEVKGGIMAKRNLAFIYLLLFLNFIMSCTSIGTTSARDVSISPTSEIQAKRFPEVELITSEGDILKGKLISLRGKDVMFSPFPYWNVELFEIKLDNIHSIKLPKKGSKAMSGMTSGFAWTFIIVGALAGVSSKYDEDFEEALLGSTILGAGAGLIGTLVGALADAGTKSEYKFYKMSESEKIRAVRKIMGN
jgi:hypothetical protein